MGSARSPRTSRAGLRAVAVAAVVLGLGAVVAPARADDGAMTTPTDGRVTGIVGGHCSTPGDGHGGVDISAPTGSTVRAAAAGTVSIAGTAVGSETYGTFIRLEHAGEYRTVYAHLSALAVAQRESVAKGQVIGYVGSTGKSSGPHLHFEVRLRNVRQAGINASFPCGTSVAQCTPIAWSFPGLSVDAGPPTASAYRAAAAAPEPPLSAPAAP